MDFLILFGLALLMLLGAFFVFILLNTLQDVIKIKVETYRRRKMWE